jgi:hypothetical protein
MQRSYTTPSPAALARAAAAWLPTPSCIQTTSAPIAIASSTTSGTYCGRRKISTNVDVLGDVAQAGVGLLAKHRAAQIGVDRQHPVAIAL